MFEGAAFVASGDQGQLRVGYQVAAELGPWSLSAARRDRWTVQVHQVRSVNRFLLEHPQGAAITAVLSLGCPGRWVAPVEIVNLDPLILEGSEPIRVED